MSIDFTPARRSNKENDGDHDMDIRRTDRKTRSGRPTSLYVRVSPEAIRQWGVKDNDFVTGHFNDGIWEFRVCKEGQSGFSFRISGPTTKVRNVPEKWGGFRLSCTKAAADKTGVTAAKFFSLAEIRGGSAFFIEREDGVSFTPARGRRSA
jgi:hypothetical protein